jgi:hypothetical protein
VSKEEPIDLLLEVSVHLVKLDEHIGWIASVELSHDEPLMLGVLSSSTILVGVRFEGKVGFNFIFDNLCLFEDLEILEHVVVPLHRNRYPPLGYHFVFHQE